MTRVQKLSHGIWFYQYHIVFVPKYRYRILKGDIGKFVSQSIDAHTKRSGCEVVRLNVQSDHVRLLVKIPPKISISSLVGKIKGKMIIQAFQKFPNLRSKRYWGNHFWAQDIVWIP